MAEGESASGKTEAYVVGEQVSERIALITGGGSGIGRSTATMLAHEGVAVAVGDIDVEHAAETAELITSDGGKAHPFALDVADPGQVTAALAETQETLGGVDYLVNLAGSLQLGNIEDISDADWATAFAVHASGTFHTCRAVLPGMCARGFGVIVNMASLFAVRGQAGAAAYAAAKGAVVAFTKSLAREKADAGIRANVVASGPVDTPFFARDMDAQTLESVKIERAKTVPLGRIADAEDIAAVIVFLLSDKSRHMTGQTISIDGGESMH